MDVLSENEIDMRALSMAETTEFGIIRVIVSDPAKTSSVLKDNNYISAITPVLAVAVPDKPGSLYEILDILKKGDINIEYTYAFITRKKDYAYMIFRVDDKKTQAAAELLSKSGALLVSQDEIYAL